VTALLPDPEDPSDDDLVVLARQARTDGHAFERLAIAVRGMVVRWARTATGDRDEAEDVAQLVLLRLQQRVGDYTAQGRFSSWLYRVTRNVVLDRQRRDRRRQLLLDAADQTVESVEALGVAEAGHEGAAPLEPLVRTFLDALSTRQQAVFEMIDLNGMAAGVVAERLGIKPSTVRVLLMQARRTMRLKMLAQYPTLLEDYLP